MTIKEKAVCQVNADCTSVGDICLVDTCTSVESLLAPRPVGCAMAWYAYEDVGYVCHEPPTTTTTLPSRISEWATQ